MSNAMTRRSTYRTGSQREDGGENLQLGCMEVAFEQWTEKHDFVRSAEQDSTEFPVTGIQYNADKICKYWMRAGRT